MQNICYELLTKGIYNIPPNTPKPDITAINAKFRSMHYTAKYWHDHTSIILIDNNDQDLAKNENARKDAELFKKLVNYEEIKEFDRKEFLLNNGWIEIKNDVMVLSRKFIFQHRSFILENSKRWQNCSICKTLVYNEDTHEYCKKEKAKINDFVCSQDVFNI
ncbi:hypothetical protein GVAV_001112 [Gurleya vavrai]